MPAVYIPGGLVTLLIVILHTPRTLLSRDCPVMMSAKESAGAACVTEIWARG